MTVLGMGLVFALLALLWVLLTLVLKLDKEEEEVHASAEADEEEADATVTAAGTAELAADLVAAITVAVAKYRAQRMPADLAAAITVAALEHRKATGPWKPAVARSFWPGTGPSRWTTEGRARARQTNNWNPWGK
ncbi:OadG family transporter subunit [uncultured Propionivibrio sp.]|uniref:OadG family transporter subunit n=1 Tax=uncultured Propionivibrio sp. TaxID=426737 RepID=UPI0029C00430|nr:OadG family transporter subunit [uncultured Propionivibrio sp.]